MRTRTNRTDRLAALFASRPGEWIDGLTLSGIAGAYAWRTRLSELRRQPHCLNIQNRQRRVERSDGMSFVISEYRLVQETTNAVSSEPMTKTTTPETTGIVSSGLR